ncbi:hypothetical protein [Yoonia sp.]|uniref:hypothetical protein n=1 Tax=Yoonia sp. TaxID=2212373 RepID=UPI00391C13B5
MPNEITIIPEDAKTGELTLEEAVSRDMSLGIVKPYELPADVLEGMRQSQGR